MSLKQYLESCPLFQGLSTSDLEALGAIADISTSEAGTRVFAEGEDARGFYIVGSGRAKIYKVSHEGKEQILQFAGPGETFAEAAVFSGSTYPASVDCVEDSELLFFAKAPFQELIAARPPIALNMIGVLSVRLRVLASLVEDLSLKEVGGRLAQHLLRLAGPSSKSITLDIPKAALAAQLGTVAETLSRTFARLEKGGIVSVSGAQIDILDRTALERLVSGQ